MRLEMKLLLSFNKFDGHSVQMKMSKVGPENHIKLNHGSIDSIFTIKKTIRSYVIEQLIDIKVAGNNYEIFEK